MVGIRKFIRGIVGGCFIGNIFRFNGNIIGKGKRKREELECGGIKIVWVMETDLGRHQGRLPFPNERVNVEAFLRKEERDLLERKENPGILKVRILDPRGEWWDLDLCRWRLDSGYVYVLTTGWYELATKNGFREGDVTRVWSFRIPEIGDGDSNSRLCFAIEVVRGKT